MSYFMCYERVAEVMKERGTKPFVVQIGAHDGVLEDPIREFLFKPELGWRGLLVEPVPTYFDRLKQVYNHISDRATYARVAIADEQDIAPDGTIEMILAPPELHALKTYASGLATIARQPRNQLKNWECETLTVDATTFPTLLKKHNIQDNGVDILQIDVEGHDYAILRQFPFDRHHPTVINLEIEHMPKGELQATQALLSEHGYAFVTNRDNLFAVDAAFMAHMITPEERAHYQKYVDDESIKDPSTLPYVVAMLDEVAAQIHGVENPRRSTEGVQEVFEKKKYVQRFQDEGGKIKRKTELGMQAVTRMRPYFKDDVSLSDFLEEELPELHSGQRTVISR